MKNRKTVARLFMAWGIILILLIVCVRGIGIFTEKLSSIKTLR